MERLDARLTAKAKRNVEVRDKMSLKAKQQPRRKDGRFLKPLPKAKDIEQNPLVAFDYAPKRVPWAIKPRLVRLISATPTHITGLEKVGDSWKYKKFLTAKAKAFRILSFNPQAMS